MIINPPPLDTLEKFNTFIQKLLEAKDWADPHGPLRFCSNLLLGTVRSAPFFHNARLLLRHLADEDGTACTVTGNLNRAFARRTFDGMMLNELQRRSALHVCKAMNESDVPGLHIARIVCECGGLAARRNKRFRATKAARALLADDRAGRLYHRLFLTHFRGFNLSYRFFSRDVPSIQLALAVTLWRLDTVAQDWIAVSKLPDLILLPSVLRDMRRMMLHPRDTEGWILAGYVLEPLKEFGLVEKKGSQEWPGLDDKDEVRLTSLWREFVRFVP